MNNRGILFSLIVMLMLLSVISLKSVNTGSKKIAAGNSVELLAFNSLEQKFDDILMNAIRFSGFGGSETVKQRILPFDFTLDQNTFTASMELPLDKRDIDIFFDALNAFEVWLEDSNSVVYYPGLLADVNTPKNPAWGGAANSIQLHVLPQCLRFKIFDENTAGFEPSQDCKNPFSVSSVSRYDVNINLSDTADFNSVTCNFDSNLECPANAFNPSSSQPFLQVNIVDANCSRCSIDPSLKTISTHFDPAKQHNILLQCVGVGCASTDLNISVSTVPVLRFRGPAQMIALGVTFRQATESLDYLDLNFSVQNPFIDARKWSD
ncbi:MAG: hypothetical protein HY392_05435 [Candidatus Diapherotrites archaeon]|nr:hypothetical protein [Candidatus Diapherotrites archaeon]